jgi:uncharacterized protein YggL (DUF469 family)
MFRFLKKKRQKKKVERELWYELIFMARNWSYNWHNYLENDLDKMPMTKDEFIDRMIKKYKLSEREKKHT